MYTDYFWHGFVKEANEMLSGAGTGLLTGSTGKGLTTSAAGSLLGSGGKKKKKKMKKMKR